MFCYMGPMRMCCVTCAQTQAGPGLSRDWLANPGVSVAVHGDLGVLRRAGSFQEPHVLFMLLFCMALELPPMALIPLTDRGSGCRG